MMHNEEYEDTGPSEINCTECKQHDSNTSEIRNTNLVVAKINESNYHIRSADHDYYCVNLSMIDHTSSRKILELVGNKAKLMESFSWLSTVGGGFSALGEKDNKFSLRAGNLSLGQQLHLAELLGDERLKVMCHLFAALAALQLEKRQFCVNYVRRRIIPMIQSLPYRDPILTNILKYICFRITTLDKFTSSSAIKN